MNLENLSTQELKDKHELFLCNMTEQQEEFIKDSKTNGFEFDYSLESLEVVENFILAKKIDINDDQYNDCATYFGEVVRTNIGGKWECSLDKEMNSLYYGFPVIFGHSKFDIQLSPFHVVKIFMLRQRKNHFLKIIENHTNPKTKNIDF